MVFDESVPLLPDLIVDSPQNALWNGAPLIPDKETTFSITRSEHDWSNNLNKNPDRRAVIKGTWRFVMKKCAMILAACGLSALMLGTLVLPTTAHAQEGGRRQGRNADRGQRTLAGRIERVTVENMTFGDNAALTVKTAEGESLTLAWANAKFHWNNADTSPSTFALKNLPGSTIAILFAQSQGNATLREAWDLISWNAELNRHKGVQTGGIVQLTNRVLTLGNFRYALTRDTVFVKAGKNATRDDFSTRQTVYVKGDTSAGVPVALVVADTEDGVNSNPVSRTNEERLEGVSPRPAPKKRPSSTGTGDSGSTGSTGNSRPPSTGASGQYRVSMYFKVIDASDNPSGSTVADAVGAAGRSTGANDNTLECFGELRVNGELVWQIDRKDASRNKKQKGETVTVTPNKAPRLMQGSYWVHSGQTMMLSGNFKDEDNLNEDDMLFPISLNLPLSSLVGQGEKVFRSPSGRVELRVIISSWPMN